MTLESATLKISSPRPSKSLLTATAASVLSACVVVTLSGCTHAPSATTPEEPASAEEEPLPFTKSPERPVGDPAPAEEDRVWLIDELGREYYVDPIPKREGLYKLLSEDRAIIQGVPVDIAGHDDEWFYVKLYGRETVEVDRGVGGEPTPEELERVAESYRYNTRTADRLRFEAFDRGLPKNGQWRNGFDIADMNGDGHLDIVHGSPRKGPGVPVIFLGDSAGTWHSWLELRFPRRYDYGDAAVADFNRDGIPDLALGIHLQGVQALVHDGEGRFTAWSEGMEFSVPGEGGSASGFSSRALATGDWNGDGLPDVIALGEGPHMPDPSRRDAEDGTYRSSKIFTIPGPTIYLNRGDGTWFGHSQNESDTEIFGDSLALGDFDADGQLDFATASSVMPRKDLVRLKGPGLEWMSVTLPGVRPGYVRAVTAADFDGDGVDDLAVAYLSYQLRTWRNGVDLFYSREGGSEWERRPLFSREGRKALYGLDHGDLDGDGALDLVATDIEGAGYVWLGDGRGWFIWEETPEIAPPSERCRSYQVRLADLDGDGRDEILANFADEANALLDPTRCPTGGGLSVWKSAPALEGTAR